MKSKNAGSYLPAKVKKQLYRFFEKSVMTRLGRSSGFVKGKQQKISAPDFVVGFLLCCLHLRNTYEQWARQISLLSGKPLSKQGVWERVSARSERFAKELLQKLLLCKAFRGVKTTLFQSFQRVLLQDSTCLHLPQGLSTLFKGPTLNGVRRAAARIQSLINVKTMQFMHFSLGSYTDNDQGASAAILSQVKKGDLLIRDLGYFDLGVFARLRAKNVAFVTRLKQGVKLYTAPGKEINLPALLKGKTAVDTWVYAGAKEKLWVRLIIRPLPPQQAAQRIRQARLRADRRYQHKKHYWQWFSAQLYLTSVAQEVWSPREVEQAYGVRWQIEMVFKSWKSGFHLQTLLANNCAEGYRVRTNIYLLLVFVCLFLQTFYLRYAAQVHQMGDKTISLLKLSAFVFDNFMDLLGWSPQKLKQQLLRYCCYEQRNDRTNMRQQLNFSPYDA